MNKYYGVIAFVLLLVLVFTSSGLASSFPSGAEALSTPTPNPQNSVTLGQPVAPHEFHGDLRKLPQVKPTNKYQPHPLLLPNIRPNKQPASNSPAPLPQAQAPRLNMPSPLTSFKGLDFATWGAGHPPDTVGDVGPNHYIQAVNSSVGIFSKTGTLQTAFTFDTLWASAGSGTPCDTSNNGDPTVLYDPLADRWIFADFAWTDTVNGPYYECFAVSKTNDPVLGGWWLYAIRADDASHPWLADYPKMGLWPDGIYMSANMFDELSGGGDSYMGVRVWAFNRSQMESGAVVQSVVKDLNTSYFTLLPSNLRGSLPPTGTPNYFVNNSFSAWGLEVWKFHVDWVTPANSTFTGPTLVTAASYTLPPDTIPALSGNALDSLSDRLMMQNQYRNIGGTESLWITHTAGSGGVAGIRWYQLNVTGSVIASSSVQSATYQPDSNYRWMPSLAVDKDGNMAVGYSVSSASMYPAIRYAGRLAGDPLNTLAQGEATLIAGTDSQQSNCGGAPCSRWGDYSAMSVDPVDDCTFWYTTEYYESGGGASGNWQTRIGSFKFPSCVEGPTPTPTVTGTPPTPTNTPITPTPTTTGPTPTPTACTTPAALSEDFETWPLTGWTIVDNIAGGGLVWNVNTAPVYSDGNYTGGAGLAADVNSDVNFGVAYDTELRSPVIDPLTLANKNLTYKANFQSYSGLDALDLDITNDGSATWTNISHWTTDHGAIYAAPGETIAVDLTPFVTGNFQLRWRYYTSESSPWDFYAQIDEVKIGTGCAPITPTNTPITPTLTNTPITPTPTVAGTLPTPTNTPITPTLTNTPVTPTPTNTPLSFSVYLPLIRKDAPPTSTPTPTPVPGTATPTLSPTATQIATPTTPAPSGPKLGSWHFASVSFPPNTFPGGGFDVTSNGVSGVQLLWSASVSPYCFYSAYAAGPFIVSNNSFSFSASGFYGQGTFTSQTSANGTFSGSSYMSPCGTFNFTNRNWTAIWTGP